MSHHQNVVRIKAVHHALGSFRDRVLYVGGASVSLYADRPSSEVRPKDDVDILIELLNYNGYAELEAQLRRQGFENDYESGIICRYRVQGIIVDVIPTNEDILGFSNRWYAEGFKHAMDIRLDQECEIRILQPHYFLATKIEAFKNRGGGDGRMSSDFEDIIFVLNNRRAIWDEMEKSSADIRTYLRNEWAIISENEYLYEWIGAHLDYVEQGRVSYIVGGLINFIRS
jgi:predicted nucleotidyltransferase